MGLIVMIASLIGAFVLGYFGFLGRKKRWLFVPATILLVIGAEEAYLDLVWEKTVSHPIRIDLLFTPFVVLVLLIWGGIILSRKSKTP